MEDLLFRQRFLYTDDLSIIEDSLINGRFAGRLLLSIEKVS